MEGSQKPEILDDSSDISEITMFTVSTHQTNHPKIGSEPQLNANIDDVNDECNLHYSLKSKNETETSLIEVECAGRNIMNSTQSRASSNKTRDNVDYFRKLREEAEGDHDSKPTSSRERGQRRDRKYQCSPNNQNIIGTKPPNNPRDSLVRRDALHVRDRLQVKSRLEGTIKDPVARPRLVGRNRLPQGCSLTSVDENKDVSRDKPLKINSTSTSKFLDYRLHKDSEIKNFEQENSNVGNSQESYTKQDLFINACAAQSGERHSMRDQICNNDNRHHYNSLALEHMKPGLSNSPKTIMATKTLEDKELQCRAPLRLSADLLCGIKNISLERGTNVSADTKLRINQPSNSCSKVIKVRTRISNHKFYAEVVLLRLLHKIYPLIDIFIFFPAC